MFEDNKCVIRSHKEGQDNTSTDKKMRKEQTIYKTLHRKLKSDVSFYVIA